MFASSKSTNHVQGAIYALLRGYLFEQQGCKVLAFDKKFLILESIKNLYETEKDKIEFDIELEDRFIEVKDITWNFVENFYNIIDRSEELNVLKNLELKKFNSHEIKLTLQNYTKSSITAKTISDMKEFMQQIKIGNEMAKHLGKEYEFYSKHAIPPVIKNWLQKHNIKFYEKDCINCACHKKYNSPWCSVQ